MADEKSPYVLVSVFKEDAKPEEISGAVGRIAAIVDDWNGQGNMIWSGAFDDNKTSLKEIKQQLRNSSKNMIMHANHFFHHTCINGKQCLCCHY